MTLLNHNTYNPWRDVDRFFGTFRNEAGWVPAFDVAETDSAYVLRGDIPGVSQKDIEVRVEDGVLTVRGERNQPEAAERLIFSGRPTGKFARRFRLSEQVEANGIKASYVDGVLELTLPKQEPVDTSRLIPVN